MTNAAETDTTTNGTTAGATAAGLRDQAAPHIEKARAFVKENKWASAAAAGVLGLALLNTLRGKR